MQQILLFALLGLGPGALIAGLALGVVVSYRGSGIINLATGGVAMLAGYAFWSLRTDTIGVQMGTAPALIVSLAFVLIVGVAIELIAFRPLRTSSPLAKLVSSLGVLLIAQAAMLLAFGTAEQNEPSVLTQATVHVLGATVPEDGFILTAIIIALAATLAAIYRWTRFGLMTRAASENEVGAMLAGLSPNTLSMANTLIGMVVAGGLGILAASITELDTETLPLQIVPALAAALIARFSSFSVAAAVGLGLGILDSLLQYVSTLSWFPQAGGAALPGIQELVTFAIIVVVMFRRGADLPGRGELVERRLPAVPKPGNLKLTATALTAICAVALVVLPFDFREAVINTLVGTLMALSLVVITGFVGQISVVQLTLAGVCGFTVSHLAVNAGIGFPVAPLLGTAAAVLLGLVTAVSALRVRGVNLAVVTLAAVVAITNFGFQNPDWGAGQTGSPVSSPHLFSLNLGPNAAFRGLDGNIPSPIFGWLVLAVTVALCVFVAHIRRGRIGMRMLAVRSNERAAAGAAINARTIKLVAFGAGAMIAGFAGAMSAYNTGSISAATYDPIAGLSLIAFAYAGGISLISGAVFAGVISTQALLPYALDKWFGLSGNWFLLFGGVMLILTLLQNPEGVAGKLYRMTHKRPEVEAPREQADAPVLDHASRPRVPLPELRRRPVVLEVKGLSVKYGGVHAVNGVDLEIHEGELVALIGPNGAGKTTLIDALTGFVAFSGTITLDGRDVSKRPAHERARLGLVRTWQGTELFKDLDVRENLEVAAPVRGLAAVGGGHAGEHDVDGGGGAKVADPLAFVGLEWAADALPDELPEGQSKLVGVARALAGEPRVLCLDEPAAGLDTTESLALGHKLRDLADRGQSMLLIDHDMGLVLAICDRVIVLEFGQVIAQGPPDQIRDDRRVIAAYLGGAEQAAAGPADVG